MSFGLETPSEWTRDIRVITEMTFLTSRGSVTMADTGNLSPEAHGKIFSPRWILDSFRNETFHKVGYNLNLIFFQSKVLKETVHVVLNTSCHPSLYLSSHITCVCLSRCETWRWASIMQMSWMTSLTLAPMSLLICPCQHASAPVVIVTSVPSRRAVPKTTTRHQWILIHRHPPRQQLYAHTAIAPVSTAEKYMRN